MMPNTKPDIKKLLSKYGKVGLETKNGRLNLVKEDGRYFYQINGCTVGISEAKLDGIIERMPANFQIRGYE